MYAKAIKASVETMSGKPDDVPPPLSPFKAAQLEKNSANARITWRHERGLLSSEELAKVRAKAGQWTPNEKPRKLTGPLHVLS